MTTQSRSVMNDLATQADLKPADGGGHWLTVTDGCDVVQLRLGDHGIGAVLLALASYQPPDPLPGLDDVGSRMVQFPRVLP